MSFDCYYARLRSCVGLGSSVWFFIHLVIPSFRTASDIFSLTLHTRLCLPPSYSLWSFLMHMWLTHKFDKDTLISLCSQEEHTATHDVVRNFFTSFIGFHVSCEQTHVFWMPFFYSSWQWVDIVLTSDGIRILVNIILVDLTCVDFVSWIVYFQGMAMTIIA